MNCDGDTTSSDCANPALRPFLGWALEAVCELEGATGFRLSYG